MTRVLVIDDIAIIRDTARSMLQPEGYEVLEAGNGREGLKVLHQSTEPLVVLLDFQMPVMTGEELLEVVVNEGGPLADHEFIIITANQPTFPESFIEMLRHLSIRVLPKPFKREDLVPLVGGAVARLAAPREHIPLLPEA